jgi:hypothetical protein
MKWKFFAAAAIVVGFALIKAGAPLFSVLLGIALAGLLNLRRLKKLSLQKVR